MKKLTLLTMFAFIATFTFAQQSLNEPAPRKTGDLQSIKGSSKSMTGTITSLNNYDAGSTMALLFSLNLASPDVEYGDSLWIQFPAGFTINSASDPFATATEGQADEALNSPIISPNVSWGDNDNAYGGIEPGVHNFYVNVTIPAGVTGVQTINWYMSGDEYGAAPNFTNGVTTINPLPSNPDIVLSAAWDNKYMYYPTNLPRNISLGAVIFNNGADLINSTKASVSIPSDSYSDSTAVTVPFAAGAPQSLVWPNPINVSTVGTHPIYFDVHNSNDFDPINNRDTIILNVSDSVYAYIDTVSDNTPLGFAAGTEGVFGSVFEIPVTANLSSVSFYVPSPDPLALVSVVVYEVDAAGPTSTVLFESDTFALSGTGPIVFNHPANYSLTGGNSYLIGVRKQVAGDLYIGRNSNGYYPDSHYAYFSGGWNEIGALGFLDAQAIFANFSQSCQSNFTFAIDAVNPMKVSFTNTSSNPGGGSLFYSWDFGNGGVANVDNPVYTYPAEGVFSACLAITDGGNCTSSSCQTVTIDDGINSVQGIPSHALKVYPNPSTGVVNFTYNKEASISVYGIDGTLLKVLSTQSGNTEIDLSELPKGTYLFKVTSEEGVTIKRISLVQ